HATNGTPASALQDLTDKSSQTEIAHVQAQGTVPAPNSGPSSPQLRLPLPLRAYRLQFCFRFQFPASAFRLRLSGSTSTSNSNSYSGSSSVSGSSARLRLRCKSKPVFDAILEWALRPPSSPLGEAIRPFTNHHGLPPRLRSPFRLRPRLRFPFRPPRLWFP